MIKINNFRLVIMLIIFSAPPFFINIFAQETGNETFNKGVKSVDVGGKSSGFSSEEYWQHISGGNSYITKGDYHLAIKQYQQALQIDLSNATAYVGLGSAYLALKEYQKALVNYEKSIQIDPENATIYYNLGICYHSLNQTQEALSSYKKALELDPNYAKVYFGLGRLYLDLKQYGVARENFNKAKKLFQKKGEKQRVMETENVLNTIP